MPIDWNRGGGLHQRQLHVDTSAVFPLAHQCPMSGWAPTLQPLLAEDGLGHHPGPLNGHRLVGSMAWSALASGTGMTRVQFKVEG